MAIHNEIGHAGESAAVAYLESKNYEILDQNWVAGKAEVDIIALYKNKIIFVEVKTRTSVAFGSPEDFVTPTKQGLLQQAAQAYIEIMDFDGEIRFDIISVLLTNHNNHTITHIEDAFWPYE